MNKRSESQQGDRPQFRRLQETGRPVINFFIDGQPSQALLGDTVLTALLMNQSFVRHTEFSGQKRAGFCLMGACQDCWIRLDSGERLRACSTMIERDMRLVTALGEGQQHE
ncbi:(2Fe-2S)-binding protein [Zwartia sp.]|uniref:(2Fe-2S)-binding protein n=1 Tax=Zwartia sp. TaxID=2978004 RepID=UPI00271F0805|nr:(2Fe-2S)-binding protein [Zwartia sp.]MDO9025497.1 (2Fe-2S)-binding protein [Zwartia sp.]